MSVTRSGRWRRQDTSVLFTSLHFRSLCLALMIFRAPIIRIDMRVRREPRILIRLGRSWLTPCCTQSVLIWPRLTWKMTICRTRETMMLPEFSTRLITLASSIWRALMERYWQMMAMRTRANTPYLKTSMVTVIISQCESGERKSHLS